MDLRLRRSWTDCERGILLGAIALLASGCKKTESADEGHRPAHDDAQAAIVATAVDASVGTPRLPNVPPPPDVAAPPKEAARTGSGLATLVVQPGKGDSHPQGYDSVRIRYLSWSSDGSVVGASSPDPNGPFFTVLVDDAPIRGLSEGLKLMVAGEKRRMWIPAPLAAGGPLVMDV